jgi:signal peptidase II
MTMGTVRGLSLALLLLVLAADQLTKAWVLHRVDLSEGPLRVTPFMDITLVWNRGISYGLFQAEGAGRWVLVGFTVAAIAALLVWLIRARHPMVAFGLAAIVGGAIGNLIDRLVHGAVVDFVFLHAAGFNWYVFNIADAAIVLGVVALLLDSFVVGPQRRG